MYRETRGEARPEFAPPGGREVPGASSQAGGRGQGDAHLEPLEVARLPTRPFLT